MRRDPLNYIESNNIYRYALSRPIDRHDPSGMKSVCSCSYASVTFPGPQPVVLNISATNNGNCHGMTEDMIATALGRYLYIYEPGLYSKYNKGCTGCLNRPYCDANHTDTVTETFTTNTPFTVTVPHGIASGPRSCKYTITSLTIQFTYDVLSGECKQWNNFFELSN